MADLSRRGADVVGVSFGGREFQRLYYETKYERRGALIYTIFRHAFLDLSASDDCTIARVFRDELSANGSGKAILEVCSVGGGPGTDAAGVVAANSHFLGFRPMAATAPLALRAAAAAAAATVTAAKKAKAEADTVSMRCDARRVAHAKRALKAAASKAATPTAAEIIDGGEDSQRHAAAAASAAAAAARAADEVTRAVGAWAAAVEAEKKTKGAAPAAADASPPPPAAAGVRVSLLDSEPQWRAYLPTLSALFAPHGVAVEFGTCDVTAGLGGAVASGQGAPDDGKPDNNAAIDPARLSRTDLW